jgi:hypothetical protein
VPDSAFITVLTSAGVAGVFCILFVLGLIYPKSVVDDLRDERDALRQVVQSERERADSAVAAAQATHDVLAALQAGVALGHQRQQELRSAAVTDQPRFGESGAT